MNLVLQPNFFPQGPEETGHLICFMLRPGRGRSKLHLGLAHVTSQTYRGL